MFNFCGWFNVPRPSVPLASDPSRKLHPTLSSWLGNMNTLFSLVGQLHDLAAAAPQEHRPRLGDQVIALRIALRRQQERCIAFLHLTGEYSERFLSDLDDEIQQTKQRDFLYVLEALLAMAKNLHQQAIHLQRSYKDEMDCIRSVQRTGKLLTRLLPTMRRVVKACISSSVQTTAKRCRAFQGNGRYPGRSSTILHRDGKALGR